MSKYYFPGSSSIVIGKISSITDYYLTTRKEYYTATYMPGWSTNLKEVNSEDRFLWNYKYITYLDGTSELTDPKKIWTYTTKAIKSIKRYYLATNSASGITTNTKGWTDYVQEVSDYRKYLWIYEVTKYSDDSSDVSTPEIFGVYETGGKEVMLMVDGQIMPCPATFGWGLQDISASESGRTEDTLMQKNRVGQKRKISLAWNAKNWAETSQILQAINPEYFKVYYPDMMSGHYETRTFYAGDRDSPVKIWWVGKKIMETVSFDIIER